MNDYTLEFSFSKLTQKVSAQASKRLDIELEPANVLKEITVVAENKNQKISETTQMGTFSAPVEQLKSVPALLGEKDLFKALQLFLGVQKGTEGSGGFYVRGNTPDRNLIMLDDAVVYNANHFFGFFSIFNGDAIKSVELIKRGFPARFGERLSFVTVINMKDRNKEQFDVEAGIGVLSSRFMLKGPIKKGKSSFMVSGRRTIFDLLFDKSKRIYFYDFNAKKMRSSIPKIAFT